MSEDKCKPSGQAHLLLLPGNGMQMTLQPPLLSPHPLGAVKRVIFDARKWRMNPTCVGRQIDGKRRKKNIHGACMTYTASDDTNRVERAEAGE